MKLQKRLTLTSVLIFMFFLALGQNNNLVINPSFEDTINGCPPDISGIFDQLKLHCKGWQATTFSSSDYFNACNPWVCKSLTCVGVPKNRFGIENAALSVDPRRAAYAGIVSLPDYREYITGELLHPLKANNYYKVSFDASLADMCDFTAKLGACFNNDLKLPIQITNKLPNDFQPVIQSAGVVEKVDGWLNIGEIIRAIGGEKFITIGDFFDEAGTNTNKNQNLCFLILGGLAYYFIDNVIVEDCCNNLDLSFENPDNNNPDSCCYSLNFRNNSSCPAFGFRMRLFEDKLPGFGISGNGKSKWNYTHLGENLIWMNVDTLLPKHNEFVGNFCIKKSSFKRKVLIEFLDKDQNVLCDTIKILDCTSCNNCAYYIDTLIVDRENPKCCWTAKISADLSACHVNSIKLINTTNGIYNKIDEQSVSLGKDGSKYETISFCFPDNQDVGESKTIKLIFQNDAGDSLCFKDVTVQCPACCDYKISYAKESKPGKCCWKAGINAGINSCAASSIYVRDMEAIQTDPPTFNYNLLASTDGALPKTIELCFPEFAGKKKIQYTFYKGDGSILCIKNDSIRCPCEGCENVDNIELSVQKQINDQEGNCCWDLYINNKRQDCDLNVLDGLMIALDETTKGNIKKFTPGEWKSKNSNYIFDYIDLKKAKGQNEIKSDALNRGEYLGRLCLDPADSLYKLDIGINRIIEEIPCKIPSSKILDCEETPDKCCSSLFAYIFETQSEPGCLCKFNIIAGQLDPKACAVNSVRILNEGEGILSGPTYGTIPPLIFGEGKKIGELCMPTSIISPDNHGTLTFHFNVVVQFLDKDGHILCSQPLTAFCTRTFGNDGDHPIGTRSTFVSPETGTTFENLNVFPNPFNNEINISYSLTEDQNIKMELYNTIGILTTIISDKLETKGDHLVKYNTASLPAGLYYIQIIANNYKQHVSIVK